MEPSTTHVQHRGTWWQRFLILLLSILLAALIYWLLGFILGDIGELPGPLYSDVEQELLDPDLLRTQKHLADELDDVNRQIGNQESRQGRLRDSTRSSQTTLNQLIEMQRLTVERGTTLSDAQRQAQAKSVELFLDNQRRDQELSESLAALSEQRIELTDRQRQHEQKLNDARKPVQEEFDRRYRRHNLKVAAIKIGTLAPLLAIGAWLFVRHRDGRFMPLIYALDVALLVKTFVVMHEHFPGTTFNYVLIISSIAAIGWILASLVRRVAAPSRDWRLAQYREAYESFFCPICRFPIRRGPLRYMAWTARSIRKSAQPNGGDGDVPYICPSCATPLFEKCDACGAIRHALLPACEHCGATHAI